MICISGILTAFPAHMEIFSIMAIGIKPIPCFNGVLPIESVEILHRIST